MSNRHVKYEVEPGFKVTLTVDEEKYRFVHARKPPIPGAPVVSFDDMSDERWVNDTMYRFWLHYYDHPYRVVHHLIWVRDKSTGTWYEFFKTSNPPIGDYCLNEWDPGDTKIGIVKVLKEPEEGAPVPKTPPKPAPRPKKDDFLD